MIIAVEGLDGAGKSTVAELLAEVIGADRVTLPPPHLKLVSSTLFENLESDARYAYYLSAVAAIAEMNSDKSLIVADRYLASAHAMHVRLRTPLAAALRALPLRAADLTVYLDVSEDVRRLRLRQRGDGLDPFEERLQADNAFRNSVAQRMCAYGQTRVIDTTGRRPEAVAEAARQVWEEVSRSYGA